jgi:hypothetical protein
MTLASMTRAAGTILVGRVTGVRVAPHPRYTRLPMTTVTLRVSETWKGRHRATFSFTHFGDVSAEGALVVASGPIVRQFRREDLPTYAVGEEIVLFLRRAGRSGLTSPVGGHLGKLIVRRNPQTGEVTVAPSAGALTIQGGRVAAAGAAHAPVPLKTLRMRAAATLRSAGDGE